MPVLRSLGHIALVALTTSYAPAMLWGGFVWDDTIYLVEAEPVRELGGLWQIWFSPGDIEKEDHYLPLLYTTFWLEHKLWGFDPMGYHVVNVLLHLANSLLVWHLMRRLAVPGAWLVAAVFAVHPLHVESVAWIIERKDVLSGLFYLAAAATWMRFVEQPSRGRYAGSLALYAAALLSKSIAVTLPAALLIWHWWKQGRITATDLKRLVPFFAVGAAYALGDLSFSRSVNPVSFDYSLIERILIASRALWFYVGKLLWPTNLAPYYPFWNIGAADRGYLIAALALVMALWYFRRQIGRGPLAGALFFAVTLSPVLGFVDHGYMQHALVADRYQYLAGIGIIAVVCGAAAQGVGHLSDLWQRGARVVAAAGLVVLGALTWQQASVWRDGETLWRHVIKQNPKAPWAHGRLGILLYQQRRYKEALPLFQIADKEGRKPATANYFLGSVYLALKQYEKAEHHLRRFHALQPWDERFHYNLGLVLYRQGRLEEAKAALALVKEDSPGFPRAQKILRAIHLNIPVEDVGNVRFAR